MIQTIRIGKNILNDHKLYQMAITYKKWPQTTPNGHKICRHFPLKVPQKYTRIWIFGWKVNHLATLLGTQRTNGRFTAN
jgi:hypothetical protein